MHTSFADWSDIAADLEAATSLDDMRAREHARALQRLTPRTVVASEPVTLGSSVMRPGVGAAAFLARMEDYRAVRRGEAWGFAFCWVVCTAYVAVAVVGALWDMCWISL